MNILDRQTKFSNPQQTSLIPVSRL